MNSLFYNHLERTQLNEHVIDSIENYARENPTEQIYLINAPLGENKYRYDYENSVIVVLCPKRKIIFINLDNDKNDDFDDYYEDFIEDLNSLSDKYRYQKHIGRARKWKSEFTTKISSLDYVLNFEKIIQENTLEDQYHRRIELMISLITGSINDIEKVGIETPSTILEKVKHNIILFDGEQTRFIYKKLSQKRISIQGLSGTGKTELLLHKLKELYSLDENVKIYFTCHNIALANNLRKRVPSFFDFMRVEKQIQWNSQLWVDRAWGSQSNKNSGLYSYICDFYNIPFYRWNNSIDYEYIFSRALTEIDKIEPGKFEFAFDYILIDEKQDFPDVFFKLCEKIVKKRVFIAGDIFQDIFENNISKEVENVDFVLNKCYRTAPQILMFAHAVGMGLFEQKKLNWLEDNEWVSSGYNISRSDEVVSLTRDSIRRFEDLDETSVSNMNVLEHKGYPQVIEIIDNIRLENPTVSPDDIAIIMLDKTNYIYEYIDTLEYQIRAKFGWDVTKAHESKQKLDGHLFISNVNNVKGLEFPFVICITSRISDSYSYRNSLYTMLTRSFLQSFLLINDLTNITCQLDGLEHIKINSEIKTIEPSQAEKLTIQRQIVKLKSSSNISFYDFINRILKEQNIERKHWKKFIQAMPESFKEDFDEEEIISFINSNRRYYC